MSECACVGTRFSRDCPIAGHREAAIQPAPATPAATPLREANQQRVDAAAQRVRKALYKYPAQDTFRKDVELLIEIALAPVLEIFAAAAQPAATPMAARDRFLAWYEAAGFWPGEDLGDFCFRVWQAGFAAAAQPQRESEIPAGLIEELDRQVHGNDSGWHACVLCGCPERGAHFPACIVAKMRQRESEQPEQALRELAEEYAESIVASYGRATDPETDPKSRWSAHVKSVTRNLLSFAKEAALSPQTDSQETL